MPQRVAEVASRMQLVGCDEQVVRVDVESLSLGVRFDIKLAEGDWSAAAVNARLDPGKDIGRAGRAHVVELPPRKLGKHRVCHYAAGPSNLKHSQRAPAWHRLRQGGNDVPQPSDCCPQQWRLLRLIPAATGGTAENWVRRLDLASQHIRKGFAATGQKIDFYRAESIQLCKAHRKFARVSSRLIRPRWPGLAARTAGRRRRDVGFSLDFEQATEQSPLPLGNRESAAETLCVVRLAPPPHFLQNRARVPVCSCSNPSRKADISPASTSSSARYWAKSATPATASCGLATRAGSRLTAGCSRQITS